MNNTKCPDVGVSSNHTKIMMHGPRPEGRPAGASIRFHDQKK